MLNKIDMSNVFYNQDVCNIKDAQRNFEISCANEWKESLSSHPKLRTYCKFKTMFSADPYILTNLPKSKRCLLAQLRIGVLPLAIETVFIMSSEKMVLKLAWFIQHSWRERQNVLFRY